MEDEARKDGTALPAGWTVVEYDPDETYACWCGQDSPPRDDWPRVEEVFEKGGDRGA